LKGKPVVLILGPSLAAISGVTTHVNSLLKSPLRAEFSLAHFQVGSEGRSESAPGRLARFLLSPFALAAAIVRRDIALVHINTSLNAKAYWRDLSYLVTAKLCGARVVLQKHGGSLREFSGDGLFAAFVRATLRLADAIVVLSQAELAEYRERLPGKNVQLLPNGIDLGAHREKDSRRDRASGPLRAIYVGRLAPRKGLSEILDAFSRLKKEKDQGKNTARLVIAGGGPDEAALKARVHGLGLEEEVSFAGPAYGEHKARLLSESDVLLLPSYSEGLPYALLEAMAAGVVPVVTRVGAIPDVVEEGVHGAFVPLREAGPIAGAITALGADRARLLRMSAACRRRVAAGYSIERLGAGFAALYSQLCAARSPRTVL
jgi:glycosyltransferase involved in cell wall biosynthesis